MQKSKGDYGKCQIDVVFQWLDDSKHEVELLQAVVRHSFVQQVQDVERRQREPKSCRNFKRTPQHSRVATVVVV